MKHFYRLGSYNLSKEILCNVVSRIPDTTKGIRDKAIILLGLVGAFRRSELASLHRSDLHRDDKGYTITVQRSKTDQQGKGTVKAIPYSSDPLLCPVRALDAWLSYHNHSSVFTSIRRGGHIRVEAIDGLTVKRVIRQYFGDAYNGHSLRVSFAVEAKRNGASDSEIMTQGWKSITSVHRYTKQVGIWENNAAFRLNL